MGHQNLDNWFGDDIFRAVGNVAEAGVGILKESGEKLIKGDIQGAAFNLTKGNIVSMADVALNGQKRKDLANEVNNEQNKAREILRKETVLYEAAQKKKSDAEAATKAASEAIAATEQKAAEDSKKTMYWMVGGGAGFLVIVSIVLYFTLKK